MWPSLASTALASFMQVRLVSSHSNTLFRSMNWSAMAAEVHEWEAKHRRVNCPACVNAPVAPLVCMRPLQRDCTHQAGRIRHASVATAARRHPPEVPKSSRLGRRQVAYPSSTRLSSAGQST